MEKFFLQKKVRKIYLNTIRSGSSSQTIDKFLRKVINVFVNHPRYVLKTLVSQWDNRKDKYICPIRNKPAKLDSVSWIFFLRFPLHILVEKVIFIEFAKFPAQALIMIIKKTSPAINWLIVIAETLQIIVLILQEWLLLKINIVLFGFGWYLEKWNFCMLF